MKLNSVNLGLANGKEWVYKGSMVVRDRDLGNGSEAPSGSIPILTERGSGRWKNILKWTGRGFAVGFTTSFVLIPILVAGAEAALTMSQNSVTLLEAMTRVPSTTILASMSGGAIVGVFSGLCGAVTLGGLALTSPEYLSVRSS